MGIQPSEFWRMSLQEFMWVMEARTPPAEGRGPRLSKADFEMLADWDRQHNGD